MPLNIKIKEEINGVTTALSYSISDAALLRELQVEPGILETLNIPYEEQEELLLAIRSEALLLLDQVRHKLSKALVSSSIKLLDEQKQSLFTAGKTAA